MPTNALTRPIKFALEELIKRQKINSFFDVDMYFGRQNKDGIGKWISDLLNNRNDIAPYLKEIIEFIWTKDEDVALEMLHKITGIEVTTFDKAAEEMCEWVKVLRKKS